jgi:hypothetical protein
MCHHPSPQEIKEPSPAQLSLLCQVCERGIRLQKPVGGENSDGSKTPNNHPPLSNSMQSEMRSRRRITAVQCRAENAKCLKPQKMGPLQMTNAGSRENRRHL